MSHPRPSWCPGALLVVTYEEQRDHERSAVRFHKRPDKPGKGGRSDVRVVCDGRVWVTRLAGGDGEPDRVVTYGLCETCSGLEIRVRESRRQTQSKGDDRW